MPKRTMFDRFWGKVLIGGDGCWEWQAGPYGTCVRRGGREYGVFYVSRKPFKAHRMAFSLMRRKPGKLHVLHTCDNPRCVRPSHLFLGTHSDNMDDMVAKCRQAGGDSRGERSGHAKLTDDGVRDIRARYAAGGVSQSALGREYGVSRRGIGHIVNRSTWAHID